MRRLAPVLLLLACTGCYPGVAWLPDSSGFVYTGGPGDCQLIHFSVKTRKSRTLVEDLGGPAWPAVSRDGRRVAVAQIGFGAAGREMHLNVFDLKGKRVYQGKPLSWDDGAGKYTEGALPEVALSPTGDRAVVTRFAKTAVVDLRTRKVKELDGSLLRFGPDIVRPDGQGFLVATKKAVQLVDWAGRSRDVQLPRGSSVSPENLMRPWLGERAPPGMSGWRRGTAELLLGSGSLLSLDTATLTATTTPYREQQKVGIHAVAASHDLSKYVTVRALVSGEHPQDRVTVQVVRREEVRPEAVVKDAHAVRFFPSPDGQYLAVGWSPGPPSLPHKFGSYRLMVLDRLGKVIGQAGGGDEE